MLHGSWEGEQGREKMEEGNEINGACLPTMQTQMYTISSVSRQQHTNAVYKALKVHSILAYACVAILRMMCHVLTK